MTAALHVEMHADHNHWNNELSLWEDDIEIWQMEINKALGELDYLKSTLQEHGKALQAHADAMRLHREHLAKHEKALADYEKGETVEELIAMAPDHQKEGAKHGQERGAHERIKKHHHTMIAQFSLLLKAMAQPI